MIIYEINLDPLYLRIHLNDSVHPILTLDPLL